MGLHCEACRGNSVGCDVASIMLKALELPHMPPRFCVFGVSRQEMGPDCALEEMIEEGDSRK